MLHPPKTAAMQGQRLSPLLPPHSCFSEDPGFSAAPLDHKCLVGRACAFLSLTPAKPGARQCSRRGRPCGCPCPCPCPASRLSNL